MHMLWLKILSKLTDSRGLFSASHWIALVGFKLSLEFIFNFLSIFYSLDSNASADLHFTNFTNWRELRKKLNWTQLNCIQWTSLCSMKYLKYINPTLLPSRHLCHMGDIMKNSFSFDSPEFIFRQSPSVISGPYNFRRYIGTNNLF